MTVFTSLAIGSDHAGFDLKNHIRALLEADGVHIEDMGTFSSESCDYPAIAKKTCKKVLSEKGSGGILICGTGIGMSIAANRIPSIRAALCTNEFHARACRQHNDANILCLGARITGIDLATAILKIFLTTPFEGGRHARRIELIESVL